MNRFLRSLHLRLALAYTLLFCLSVILLGLVTVWITSEYFSRQMQAHLQYNANQLLNDYYEDGIEELRHDIHERVDTHQPDRLWYFLRTPEGKVEFDPLSHFPEPGWHTLEESKERLLFLSIELKDGYALGLAVGLDNVSALERVLRNTFVISILLSLVLGAVGGIFLSRAFLARLENLKKAMASVGQGQLDLRLPLKGTNDEFDQIASIVNGMLSRIETLVREVEVVSANVAHDLRTPLGRIKQKIELMEDSGLPAPAKENVREISALLDGALDTFTSILRIAEVNSGSRRAEFKSVDLAILAERIESAYRAVVEDSSRIFELNYEPGLKAFGDSSLLTQLLANLIENALQHTPVGTRIEIDLYAEGGRACVIVADSGPGIRVDEREKIFQPFFKLDRSRNSPGSGLGLSLVAAIARLHEAEVIVKDNGPGLRIEMRFPQGK